MGKEKVTVETPVSFNRIEDETRMQEQPRVCGTLHSSCDRNPKCTCTTTCDSTGKHPGSHTSPFHIWF